MADEVEYGGRPRVDTGGLDGWKKCLLIFLGVGILLMVIILPISFVGVEYYQVCFHMYKSCIMISKTLKNGKLKRNFVLMFQKKLDFMLSQLSINIPLSINKLSINIM